MLLGAVGLVGVGGGAVAVPLMVLETKRAVSTSLVVLMFAALVGAIGYVATGFENLLGLPPLMVVVALHMLAEATGIL